MAGIRGKNTRPEMVVRQLIHAAGLRFRLQGRKLPGSPDLVLPKYRVVIFVHGCFWHAHNGCAAFKIPRTNTKFWSKKLKENKERDNRQLAELKVLGWRVLVVWECATRNRDRLSLLQEKMAFWIKKGEALQASPWHLEIGRLDLAEEV